MTCLSLPAPLAYVKKRCLILVLLVCQTSFLFGQAPAKVWDKTFGGSFLDIGLSLAVTTDGGYVIVGESQSNISGDKTEDRRGDSDYWVVKFNSSGQKLWDKTIGGDKRDIAQSVVATTDGGIVITGWSESGISGDKTEAKRGNSDYWVVKLNSSGQKLWDKTLGGDGGDVYSCIMTTPDGSLVIAGWSNSGISGDKTEASRGEGDIWVVKLNSSGQKLWDKTLGGNGSEDAGFGEGAWTPSVVALADGSLIIASHSESGISGDKTEASRGGSDYWVVKLNSNGQKLWDKTIGGNGPDLNPRIVTTSDGSLVLAGYSTSDISGDKTESSRGNFDYWIVKLNSSGQKIWDKTLGGVKRDVAQSIVATADGSLIIAGSSYSDISVDKTEYSKGESDSWIVRLNSSGQKIWDKTLGGNKWDGANSIVATADGGLVISGTSDSGISGDKTEANRGVGPDYWIVKLGGSSLTANLIGYYPFTGNASNTAQSKYHGVVSGATLATDRTNVANQAYSFDGNSSQIELADMTEPFTNTPFTVGAWFYTNTNDGLSRPIFSTARNGQNFYVSVSGGKTYFVLGTANGLQTIGTTQNILNGWHSVVVMYDLTTAKVYIDGQLTASRNLTLSRTLGRVYIGNNSGSTFNGGFNGKIDEVRYWTRIISDSEVQQLYGLVESPVTLTQPLRVGGGLSTLELGTSYGLTGEITNKGTTNSTGNVVLKVGSGNPIVIASGITMSPNSVWRFNPVIDKLKLND